MTLPLAAARALPWCEEVLELLARFVLHASSFGL
jgi:hypothetical protein